MKKGKTKKTVKFVKFKFLTNLTKRGTAHTFTRHLQKNSVLIFILFLNYNIEEKRKTMWIQSPVLLFFATNTTKSFLLFCCTSKTNISVYDKSFNKTGNLLKIWLSCYFLFLHWQRCPTKILSKSYISQLTNNTFVENRLLVEWQGKRLMIERSWVHRHFILNTLLYVL